jgi:hypothetical protein
MGLLFYQCYWAQLFILVIKCVVNLVLHSLNTGVEEVRHEGHLLSEHHLMTVLPELPIAQG